MIGRFVTADPVIQDYFDPQTLNRYSYTRNNPLIFVDPSGNTTWYYDETMGTLGTKWGTGQREPSYTKPSLRSKTQDAIRTRADQFVNPSRYGKDQGTKNLMMLVEAGTIVSGSIAAKAEQKVLEGTAKAATAASASKNTKPRFIADEAGNIVDTQATPPGRYIQPDKSATDILQDASHPGLDDFTSRTHTHKATVHVNPNDPTKGATKLTKHPDPVTADEVKNIMDGTATRSKSRGH